MKVVTWNVNSLTARGEYVSRYLEAEVPDILCIQELKLATEKVPTELFESRGYEVAVHGQPQWNGVLIASRVGLDEVEMGLPDGDQGQSRLIAATIDGVRYVNLYCPQGGSADSEKFPYKLAFYDALISWTRRELKRHSSLVVLGDLNVAPQEDDVWDPAEFVDVPSHHPEELTRWAELVGLGLTDVVYPRLPANPKERFSFWDYRGMSFRFNKGMRIDHVLVTDDIADRVASARVVREWRKKMDGLTPSDHAPVEVVLDG